MYQWIKDVIVSFDEQRETGGSANTTITNQDAHNSMSAQKNFHYQEQDLDGESRVRVSESDRNHVIRVKVSASGDECRANMCQSDNELLTLA